MKTSLDWQQLLDEKFPEGSIVSRVLPDGTLSAEGMYLCPVLVVMAMDGEWPLVVGIDPDGHDLQLHVGSWEEIDRDGHFVARVRTRSTANSEAEHYEISSWLSPVAAASMARVREAQRDWLLQIAESAEAESDVAPELSESDQSQVAEPVEVDPAVEGR